mgnify:CR=1 FL=1
MYHPVSSIVSNDLTIAGIRLFSYEKTPDSNYLYIGRTSDFVKRSQAQEVLLVHRKDVISLRTQELEDVFDTIMDAFVFYQQWEQNMLSAFQSENPEQTIIDACADLFGPIFFINNSLQITAFSRQYPKGSINKNWDDFWDFGALSVDSLVHMQNGTYMEKIPQKWNCEIFYEKYAGNYPYSMMISQENAAHQLTGQMVFISRTPFETYQEHLALILKQALCLVAGHETHTLQGNVIQIKPMATIYRHCILISRSLFSVKIQKLIVKKLYAVFLFPLFQQKIPKTVIRLRILMLFLIW